MNTVPIVFAVTAILAAPAAAQTRVASEAPATAIGCTTGDNALAWTLPEESAIAVRRSGAGDPPAIGPQICASAQAAMMRLNASETARAALAAAVDTGDAAALRALLVANGLSPDLTAGAQFHAINTKGTGGVNGRTAASGTTIGVGYDARTKRGYSLAMWMHFNAK